jgi:putative ABC transport system substrate-binding protein
MSCETPAFVEAGCFVAYGPDFAEMWRRAAYYVVRIVEGARPADLPVEQPTKFDFVINMRTAQALGVSVPTSLLERADRVVE